MFREGGWIEGPPAGRAARTPQLDGDDVIRGAGGIAEGLPEGLAGATVPKFGDDGLLLVHAGGGAGLFSAIIGGWINGPGGSQPVTRRGEAVSDDHVSCSTPPASGRSPHASAIAAARRRSTGGPSACSTSPSRAATCSSTGSRSGSAERGLRCGDSRKPTFSKPAPIDLRHEIGTQCDVVIEALAD